MDGWMDGLVNECKDGRIDGRRNGVMEGWRDGRKGDEEMQR